MAGKLISYSPLGSKEDSSRSVHAKRDDECECASRGKASESQLVLLKKKEEGRDRVGRKEMRILGQPELLVPLKLQVLFVECGVTGAIIS